MGGLLATWKLRTHTRVCPEPGSVSSPLRMHRSRPFSNKVSLRAGPELLIPHHYLLPLKNQEKPIESPGLITCPCKSKGWSASIRCRYPMASYRTQGFSVEPPNPYCLHLNLQHLSACSSGPQVALSPKVCARLTGNQHTSLRDPDLPQSQATGQDFCQH